MVLTGLFTCTLQEINRVLTVFVYMYIPGKKVQDAAKEVTDFLTSAIGSHATTRADSIRQDKQKG